MKKILYILFATMLMTACSGSSDTGSGGGGGGGKTYSVTISSGQTSTVEAAGGKETITFTANDSWTASASESWCSLDATSGTSGTKSITVTVASSELYSERNCAITIKCGTASARATITQKQNDAIILSSDKVEIDYNGGTAEISLKSNVNYTYEITAGSEWITEDSGTKALVDSKIALKIAENWEKSVRTGEVTITDGQIVETVDIYQQASTPRIVLTETEYDLPYGEGQFTVELKTNCDYTLQMPQADWISEVQTKGASTYTHTFSVTENKTYENRSAEIKFVNNETSDVETVTVYQSQENVIVIAKNSYDVTGNTSTTLDFTVNTNVDFETEIDVDWIVKNTDTKGLEDVPLSFEVAANPTAEARTGKIILSYSDKVDMIKQTITVNQAGNTNVSELKIVHNSKTFKVPEIDCTSGTIDWGDGSSATYSKSASHTYSSEADRTVTIRYIGTAKVTFNKLTGVKEVQTKSPQN